MSKKIYQEDARTLLESGEYYDAEELLLSRIKDADKKFQQLCTRMKGFLNEIKKEFPDANYYTGSGGFHLLLGSSHDEQAEPNQIFDALSANNGLHIGDGDW